MTGAAEVARNYAAKINRVYEDRTLTPAQKRAEIDRLTAERNRFFQAVTERVQERRKQAVGRGMQR